MNQISVLQLVVKERLSVSKLPPLTLKPQLLGIDPLLLLYQNRQLSNRLILEHLELPGRAGDRLYKDTELSAWLDVGVFEGEFFLGVVI